jgi:hypothetical protein
MSQSEAILAHLQAGKSITALQALKLFGANRLASRIYEIRRSGHAVEKETIHTKTRKQIARYTLPGPSEC